MCSSQAAASSRFYFFCLFFYEAACASLTELAAPFRAVGPVATVWQPFEIALTSSAAIPQPTVWLGTNLTATLHHAATDTTLATPGFWDGGLQWLVRFSPPLLGAWVYTTTCSDINNTGLHNVTGSFTAAAYTGSNPLFAHGILRPNGGGRFLEHADGTPFYWLGDTHWSGFSDAEVWRGSDNTTVDPDGPRSMLKEMVDVRALQGYSVWKGETFVVNGKQGDEHGKLT